MLISFLAFAAAQLHTPLSDAMSAKDGVLPYQYSDVSYRQDQNPASGLSALSPGIDVRFAVYFGINRDGDISAQVYLNNDADIPDRLVSVEAAPEIGVGESSVMVLTCDTYVPNADDRLLEIPTSDTAPAGRRAHVLVTIRLSNVPQGEYVGTIVPLVLNFERAGRVEVEVESVIPTVSPNQRSTKTTCDS